MPCHVLSSKLVIKKTDVLSKVKTTDLVVTLCYQNVTLNLHGVHKVILLNIKQSLILYWCTLYRHPQRERERERHV